MRGEPPLRKRRSEASVQANPRVYPRAEWEALLGSDGRFARVLRNETLWMEGA